MRNNFNNDDISNIYNINTENSSNTNNSNSNCSDNKANNVENYGINNNKDTNNYHDLKKCRIPLITICNRNFWNRMFQLISSNNIEIFNWKH
jgi:hypothetical protein